MTTPPSNESRPRDARASSPGPDAPDQTGRRSQDPAEDLTEQVRDRVLAVPGVVRLHGGRFGEIGTYLPGRTVVGIRQGADGTEVHIVIREDADLRAVAQRVHHAVSSITGGAAHVHIDDLAPGSPSDPYNEPHWEY